MEKLPQIRGFAAGIRTCDGAKIVQSVLFGSVIGAGGV